MAIRLKHPNEAAERAFASWGLRSGEAGTDFEGEIAACDRLRFLGVIARYAGIVSDLRLGDPARTGGRDA